MATKNNTKDGSFGERLYALRQNKGYTQGEIAEYLGVTKATISRYESGSVTDIPRTKIAALAELFRVSPAYLMGWTDDPTGEDIKSDKREKIGVDLGAAYAITPQGPHSLGLTAVLCSETERTLLRLFRSLSERGQDKVMAKVYTLVDEEDDERPKTRGGNFHALPHPARGRAYTPSPKKEETFDSMLEAALREDSDE